MRPAKHQRDPRLVAACTWQAFDVWLPGSLFGSTWPFRISIYSEPILFTQAFAAESSIDGTQIGGSHRPKEMVSFSTHPWEYSAAYDPNAALAASKAQGLLLGDIEE